MITDWQQEIGIAIQVKQALQEADTRGVWVHHLPEVAASEADLRFCEQQLLHELDLRYRAFLRVANGWKSFYQSVDLFGTGDLIGSGRMQSARRLLTALDRRVIADTGCGISELLPIAASGHDKDLFVIAQQCSQQAGKVFWFAGEEIDRYPSFDGYFLAMIEYNRVEVGELEKLNTGNRSRCSAPARSGGRFAGNSGSCLV